MLFNDSLLQTRQSTFADGYVYMYVCTVYAIQRNQNLEIANFLERCGKKKRNREWCKVGKKSYRD